MAEKFRGTRQKPGPSPAVIILAAGRGTRMKSVLPKVLHEIGGEPLLYQILDRILEITPDAPVAIVVGYGGKLVEEAVRNQKRFAKLKIDFVVQAEQRGTGHAALVAMQAECGERWLNEAREILILPGDIPLMTGALVKALLEPLSKGAVLRLLSTVVPDATGLGRIVRKGKAVQKIVEHKDASAKDLEIREVALSTYLFQSKFLAEGLKKLTPKNVQAEYYLTDLIAQATKSKRKIDSLIWDTHQDLQGINDPWELALVQKIFNERVLQRWARAGVYFQAPATTFVDAAVNFKGGAQVARGVHLKGVTTIGANTSIGAFSTLENVEVGEDVEIKQGTFAVDSKIASGAKVGPYAHLRPHSQVGSKAKIGNFVELKNSSIGAETSVAHLSYVGDAEIGARVNIGCGFVTCNFDGRVINGSRKHKTIVEDDAFIGSDCQTVAPVKIGRGAYVASGSTITQDVEAGALGIARSRQTNKPGYASKLKSMSESNGRSSGKETQK